MAALVGRAAEVAELWACLDAAADGSGQVRLVAGAAGIGKSRLLDESLRRAQDHGAVVLHARAEEFELARPFGPLAAAVAGSPVVAPEVARLVVAAGRGGGLGIAQFQVVDRLLDHLEDLAASAPVVVAVDDLQWADPGTLITIQALAQRLTSLPVALLLTVRPLPRSRQLDRVIELLLAHPGARLLQLAPLTDDEVATLLADEIAAEPGSSLRVQVRRAAGNPFYLHELLRALDEAGATELRDGRVEVVGTDFPATLGSTILRHLRFLDPASLELLELAAVLGTTFAAGDLAALSRRPVAELVEPLREGTEAGILHDRPGGFAFRHDLVRETLYRRLPQGLREQLHLDAGRALAAVGAPTSRVATHLAIGAQPGDHHAIDLLRRAALELAMAAPEVAEGFARRAIELAGPHDPVRDHLRADLVTLLVASGRATGAHELARELLAAGHERSLDGRVRFALGQASFLLGDTAEAVAQMQVAARHDSLSPAEQSLVLAEAGMAQLLAAGDLAGAETDATEAREAARSAGDRVGESMALCVLAAVDQFRGNVASALATVEHATRLGAGPLPMEPGTLTSALRDPHMFRGMALLDADDLEAAGEAFRAGAATSADRGVAGRGHFYHYWQGYRHHLAGTWDDARAELSTGLALADEIENQRGTLAAHALLGLMALHRDDLDQAHDHLEASEVRFERDGPDFGVPWLLLGRALLAEARGDTEAGCAALLEAWEGLAELGCRFHFRTLGPDLARLAVAAGRRGTAREVAAATEGLAADEPLATIRGTALYCRGVAEEDEGALLAAVEALGEGPRPLPLAAALEAAARVLAPSAEGRGQARRLFVQARETYARLPAERDVARVTAHMRAAGFRTGAAGPRRRPDHGWESLTPTEVRVVALVAQGLSNPQIGQRLFVSRRTVQTHVSSVLRKLALASRAEVAAEAARRGEPAT